MYPHALYHPLYHKKSINEDSPGTSDKNEAAAPAVASVTEKMAFTSLASQGSKGSWPNSAEDYEIKEIIGVGATAVVHAAYCKPRDEKCAIKRINLEKWNTSMDELLKEIQAMSSCNNENVVSYFTSFVYKEELWLVLRLLSSGSLLDIIRHKMKTQDCKHGVLDEMAIATVLREVLKGLEYLHQNGHIHRDIKAGNILLGSEGQVQIADFGVSAWLASGGDQSRAKSRHTFVGTPCWMAPEIMEQGYDTINGHYDTKGYGYKADIWSFGITAIELATGKPPYHGFTPMKVLMSTIQKEPPTLESGAEDKEQYKQRYGTRFRKMISECLQKDPSNRPTATELLKHSFFKNKAKDKKYLKQNLVPISPSVSARVLKYTTHNMPGMSGRLHRNEVGEWVWSSDEDEDTDNTSKKTPTPPPAGGNVGSTAGPKVGAAAPENVEPIINPEGQAQLLPNNQKTLSIVLRMRNPRRELNDIRFEYQPTKDTTDGIANELLTNGLIAGNDVQIMSNSMLQLIENPPPNRVITFRVSTGFGPEDSPDEKNLLGYAQLSLAN